MRIFPAFLNRPNHSKRWAMLAIFLTVGSAGILTVLNTSAATFVVKSETEAGTISAQASIVADSAASAGNAVKFGTTSTTDCTISAKLVNSCRPWLGGFASANVQFASDAKSQLLGHESLIGRQLDMAHTYHPAGNNTLSATDKYFATRPDTILVMNWKPSANWKDASGDNASVNAGIDQMAASIKTLGDTKILLVLYHEPENDVSSDVNCPDVAYKGSAGTPTDYRNMWANVQNRFEAAGTTNVVWGMNYMGFASWNCLIKDLWPGNGRVDWVLWDPYSGSNADTWDDAVGRYYDWFTQNSDSTHDFLSKPWGLGEFGIGHGTTLTADQAHTYQFYDDAKAGLSNNKYSRIKAYLNFDSQGVHDTQIAYVTTTHAYDASELQHYKAFAQDPRFSDSFYQK
jgi:beta-mannanase